MFGGLDATVVGGLVFGGPDDTVVGGLVFSGPDATVVHAWLGVGVWLLGI